MSVTLAAGLGGRFGEVLHIGAGAGADLPRWRALATTRVTLVEADPVQAGRLETAAAATATGAAGADAVPVQVIEGAVTADGTQAEGKAGPVMLCRYALPGLASLRPATGLMTLYPGLRQRDEIAVRALDPVQMVRELELAEAADHLLAIEAPGEVLSILEALAGADLLTRFQTLVLQADRDELWQGAGTLAQVTARLGDAGFAIFERPDSPDPDRPLVMAWQDRAQQAREAGLRADLGAARAALEEARADHAAALAAAGAAHAEALGQEQAAARKARADAIEAEETARTGVTEAKAQSDKAIAEAREALREEIARTRAEVAEVRSEAAAKEASAGADLAQAQEEAQKDIAQRDAQIAELRARLEATAEAEADSRQDQQAAGEQLQSMMSDLRAATRLQLMVQQDLEDLQSRHARLRDDKDAQDALLAQVAQALDGLAGTQAEAPPDASVEAPVEAPRKPTAARSRGKPAAKPRKAPARKSVKDNKGAS